MKIKRYLMLYIDQDYIRVLNEADQRPEAPTGNVYHQEKTEYQFKPYIGILTEDDRAYAVPMTSAKEKHAGLEDVSSEGILVYQYKDMRELKHAQSEPILVDLSPDDPFFEEHPEIKDEDKPYYKKHIENVCDTNKIIPIPKFAYTKADFRRSPDDTPRDKRRKYLLKEQYFGLISHQKDIEEITSTIYNRQMEYGIIGGKEPDIANLEIVSDIWVEYQEDSYQQYKDGIMSDWMYNRKKNETLTSFLKRNYGIDKIQNFPQYCESEHNKKSKENFNEFLNKYYEVDNIKDAIEVIKEEEKADYTSEEY